ncbi:MAG: hypothetical protein ACXVR1_04275 [Solirubrobacteraceae bacterium]
MDPFVPDDERLLAPVDDPPDDRDADVERLAVAREAPDVAAAAVLGLAERDVLGLADSVVLDLAEAVVLGLAEPDVLGLAEAVVLDLAEAALLGLAVAAVLGLAVAADLPFEEERFAAERVDPDVDPVRLLVPLVAAMSMHLFVRSSGYYPRFCTR